MTDVAVGTRVQDAEFPPTVWSADSTDITSLTVTAFTNGSPEVSVTFTAPFSGRVLIINGAGTRNDSGADQVYVDSEVRVTNGAGAVVVSSSVTGPGTLSCADESLRYEYQSRAYVVTGLTPGGTYFARLQYRASSGAGTADIASRSIIVQPIP
ncbi:hypothetical protein [Nonomuraea gerenzanensis]|uniref:Uncharacterized protein n=1 Tax=Nonomuraea gerenzanensis TaxID=93944 RepID=A0A1M4EMM6_9ACTN|nr:hypothetical protein [Nonomuraea gerenzanensis]UBU11596.1 hypothetical protein LCN96_46035 [Nonomuraea gerenzanensis]SBP00091.1 hypothetical protein BN4615_P9607 [Nonomuraea gerenzanensis]